MDLAHGTMELFTTTVNTGLHVDKLDDMVGNAAVNESQMPETLASNEPYVDMEFESEEAARAFYKDYAERAGFSIRVTGTCHSKRDTTLIGRDFVCYKEGFHAKKCIGKLPKTRDDCKAMIRVKKFGDKWIVTRFVKDHNHDLVSSGKVSLLHPQERKANAAKRFMAALDEANTSLSNIDPYLGMEFDSDVAARIFYYQYAKRLGFSIRVATTRRARHDGTIIGRYFVCSKEGFRLRKCSNKRPTTREGCKAMLGVKRSGSGKWVVTKLEKDHNHDMGFPGKGSLFRQLRHAIASNSAKSSADAADQTRSLSAQVVVPLKENLSGPNNIGRTMPFESAKHVQGGHKKILGRDAQNVLEYFKRMQAKNPAFFYAVQLDNAHRLSNFLWVDARSRMAYSYLGDVVTVDTTYRKNMYGMPFVLFVGIDQHKQFVLFGCGLLLDESEASFLWLFNTWLEAMHGCHPDALITDDDPAIISAVAQVFPKARHCFCKRHILRKFSRKLGRLESKHKTLKEDFLRCINLIESNDEFEACWWPMLDKYELQENEWLYSLYRSKENWVKVYFQGAFFANVNTGQQNGSISSFLDVNEHTSLLVFVIQCEQAIDGWFEKQLEEDCKSSYMKPILKTGFPMEIQAAEFYTRIIFLEFQEQLVQSVRYLAEITSEDGCVTTFKVVEFGDEKVAHAVSFNSSENSASCSCQLFEYAGILCRHILRVFMVKNVMMLPSHYMLKRWTRGAMSGDATYGYESNIQVDVLESRFSRYGDLCREAIGYALEGAMTNDIYNLAKRAIRKALEEVRALKRNAATLVQHASLGGASTQEEIIYEQGQAAYANSNRCTPKWSKFF